MTDDDLDPGPIPDPDAEPTPAEKARARAFADLVDKVVAGRAPAAMSPEDRALAETATMIRASAGKIELAPARAKMLVDQALSRAVDQTIEKVEAAPVPPAAIPIDRARRSRAPWIVAGVSTLVAAAAVFALVVRPPPRTPAPAPAPTAQAVKVPETWTSRPADPLVGVIPEERAGEAAARIDAIFADRLDGYRERTLARGGRSP